MQPIAIAASLSLIATAAAQSWFTLDGPFPSTQSGAYDFARERFVSFDGLGNTWEIDGLVRLHRQQLAAPPPVRRLASFCFDAPRARVLMFGGQVDSSYLGDLWAWDGAQWTRLVTAVTPSARAHAGFGWDLVRSRALLFGGQGSGPWLTDTWEFDGAQWVRRLPATVPATNPEGLIDDVARNEMLLLGSATTGQPVDLWRWNGSDWSLAQPPGQSPIMRTNAGFAFDIVRQRAVLIGGETYGPPAGTEVWEWDGTAWTQAATLTSARLQPAAAWYDAGRGKVVVAGGRDAAAGGLRSDAWAWDGAALAPLWPTALPLTRYGHAWVHDAARGRTLMFGGNSLGTVDDTWTWDGMRWQQQSPAIAPSPRQEAGAAFDEARGEAVLFGGAANGGYQRDTWVWNGATWALRNQAGPAPVERCAAAMAFDGVLNEVLLFGGLGAGNARGGDTWSWNGTQWTPRPGPGPSPRDSAAMVFDPVRQRTVLFGGRNGFTAQNQLADTWEWYGGAWHVVAPLASPPALGMPGLVFDDVAGRVLLHGTEFVVATQSLVFQVWEYDGVTWTSRDTQPAIGGQQGAAVVWDARRQRMLAYDGYSVREWNGTPATASDLGSACGVAGVLQPRARLRLGDAQCGVEVLGRANQAAIFGFASSVASTPLGNGCTLRLGAGPVASFAVAGANGRLEQRFAIPLVPAFRGLTLVAQTLLLDPTQPGGFALSNALSLTVGD